MSTSLQKSIPSLVFVTEISRLKLTTSDKSVSVKLKCDDILFIDEIYVPNSSKEIEIADIDKVLMRHLLSVLRGNLQLEYTSGTSTERKQAVVLFSLAETEESALEFTKKHFLTWAQSKRIGQQWTEILSYYSVGTGRVSVTAKYSDGTSKSFTGPVTTANSVNTIDVSPKQYMQTGKELSRVIVSHEDGGVTKKIEYEVMQDYKPSAPRLIFRNSFGCEETFYCQGTHNLQPTYNSTFAKVNGDYLDVDKEEQKIFEANTGVLTSDMAMWADDLFRSLLIVIMQKDANGSIFRGKQITITSAKAERSSDGDNLPSYSFSYRYAQRNHNIFEKTKAGRIFDNTFDNTYD